MHSKWKIWDFFSARETLIKDKAVRIFAFQTSDPFAFRLLKERYLRNLRDEVKPITMMGKDVQKVWIEDNFFSLGLFGNSDSYLILNADQLPKDSKELLLKTNELILDDCYLFFDFEKEDEFVKQLKKSDIAEVIKIEAPAFWEQDKLLDFICSVKSVYLSMEAKRLIIEKLNFDFGSYFNIVTQIDINFPERMNISDHDIASLVASTKIDNFELAELFASKKFKAFYGKLLELESEKEMGQIFRFMQSHLLKVLDPSFLNAKSKLNKYDRQIMSQSSAWREEPLSKAIKYFGELELLCKTKNPLLKARLQRDKLRSDLT